MTFPRIGIAAAADASGLSAHTLRAWERRYGFPAPVRTAGGERLYSAEEVAKLSLVRRLIERGHRVSKIVALPSDTLQRLLGVPEGSVLEEVVPIDFQECLRHLCADSIVVMRRLLHAALVRQGLARFVLDTARPLTRLVGDWWADGKLQVFQEHLFAEQLERLLREAMSPLEPDGGPTVVLTTLPGEQHRLGLLMVEALLRLNGAACIPLGAQIPSAEIVKLCATAKAYAVALSFSASYEDPNGRRALSLLRRELGKETAIWAGGRGAARVARGLTGVVLLPDLEDALAACREWRAGDGARHP